jgi:hypothetical protein
VQELREAWKEVRREGEAKLKEQEVTDKWMEVFQSDEEVFMKVCTL